MVQVTSGIIMDQAQQLCVDNSGSNWAQAFAASLADQWYGTGRAAKLYHAWGWFYATANTQTLYCTTLAAELSFYTKSAADAFRVLARQYLSEKMSVV